MPREHTCRLMSSCYNSKMSSSRFWFSTKNYRHHEKFYYESLRKWHNLKVGSDFIEILHATAYLFGTKILPKPMMACQSPHNTALIINLNKDIGILSGMIQEAITIPTICYSIYFYINGNIWTSITLSLLRSFSAPFILSCEKGIMLLYSDSTINTFRKPYFHILGAFSREKSFEFWWKKTPLRFVLKSAIGNTSALVWVMAWRRIGDKALS